MGPIHSSAEKMWLHQHIFLAWLLALANSCPCKKSDDTGEITCESGTQNELPFSLPECLSVDNDEVQRLILAEQNFDQLVSGSFHLFPNLRYLDLSYCNIAFVDELSFDDNSKLETLFLTGNKISSLPRLFTSNQNMLQLLTLRHNMLESVDSTNLQNLQLLDLDFNSMSEAAVSETLNPLHNLQTISLDSNSLRNVLKTTFSKQENLRRLTLWNNKIEHIEPGSFDHISGIEYLDLQSNPLGYYRTESWHFCHSLNTETLEMKMDESMEVTQDLKIDQHTDTFCGNPHNQGATVETSCSEENGHLSCGGNIEDIVCELKSKNFTSISFLFHKDDRSQPVEEFHEAETNDFFRTFNNLKGNTSQYINNAHLYGTKFDLATLDEYVGSITESVIISADTVFMSRPLAKPVHFQLTIRARVVSISEDISMVMTKEQFFNSQPADQKVDNWATVQEIISGVGDVTFSVRRLGYVSVQKVHQAKSISFGSTVCSPRNFSVEEYETEHLTKPSVFFDNIQMNLLRMAVRTLASTRSNTGLALNMAEHTLGKTTDPSIVADKHAYVSSQKLVRDRERLLSHKRNVPFYSTKIMKELAEVMYTRMLQYYGDETVLLLKIDIALGRMQDMDRTFTDAKLTRELYFEMELQTLEEIWNSTDTAWHWNFDASRNMESSIQDSIDETGNAMYEMQEEEMEEMLAKAKDTVISTQEIIDNVKESMERYAVEAKLSLDNQRRRVVNTTNAGHDVEREEENLEDNMQDWKDEQRRKAAVGFFTAFLSVIGGLATFNPGKAITGIAKGIAYAEAAGEKIEQAMEGMVFIIEALAEVEQMIDQIDDMPDPENAYGAAIQWRGALENAYKMKELTIKFDDVKNLGITVIGSISDQTDGGVNPSKLQQAMFAFTDSGSELVKESVNYAELIMLLADLAGDLKVAEQDLQNAVNDVERIQKLLVNLQQQHQDYIDEMQRRRDEYQDMCDDFENEYNNATTETKEAFKKDIMELFNKFKEKFEESNKNYTQSMNQLTGALFTKVVSLKQHSMLQRSMIMNLYQDFCDGLFFFSFSECDSNLESYPTMSAPFETILESLNNIAWDSITSLETLPNPFEKFTDVPITMMDQQATGFNSSDLLVGPATSLRESGGAYFNLKDHTEYFDPHYRTRLETIQIHLLDVDGNLFLSSPDDFIQFKVYFPLEFKNTDTQYKVHSFRAIGKVCSADYRIDDDGDVIQMAKCEIDQEFDGVNHKTSHDGMFRITAENVDQTILDQVNGLKITVSGSYITRGKKENFE